MTTATHCRDCLEEFIESERATVKHCSSCSAAMHAECVMAQRTSRDEEEKDFCEACLTVVTSKEIDYQKNRYLRAMQVAHRKVASGRWTLDSLAFHVALKDLAKEDKTLDADARIVEIRKKEKTKGLELDEVTA